MRVIRPYSAVLTVALLTGLCCGQAMAVEVGERAPRVTVQILNNGSCTLPLIQKSSHPVLIWFASAEFTPKGIGAKLASVCDSNEATLVVIPIFDRRHYRAEEEALNTATALAEELKQSNAAPLSQEECPSPSSQETVTTETPVTQPEQVIHPNVTVSSTEQAVQLPNGTRQAEQAKLPPDGTQRTEQAKPSPDETQQAEQAEQSPSDAHQAKQSSELETLHDIASRYPKAYIVHDTYGQAQLAYTNTYNSNLTPRPNLFVIDKYGNVSWTGFYPGLTVGSITRAILTADPKHTRSYGNSNTTNDQD